MMTSPFDHPFLSGLLGDEEVGGLFTAEADIRAMMAFEAALAMAEARHAVVPEEHAVRITETCRDFMPDVGQLRSATAKDGVVVPELVRQLRAAVDSPASRSVHFGATSQDVVDSSLMLRLKSVFAIYGDRLAALSSAFDALELRFGEQKMTAHTRMQPAMPVTSADRIRGWRSAVGSCRERVLAMPFVVQFGGAVGTLGDLGKVADDVRADLARELQLADAPQWHNRRLPIADMAGLMSMITGSLGKFGQDIALLAEAGTEIALSGGGASSAMAHKQNPVAAEVLVSLARFNATQVSAIHQSLVHEQERSGAAWTLEWLVLPQMAVATGAALRLAAQLASDIRRLGPTENAS